MLLHTQSIVCATVDSQCLEYLGYITLVLFFISLFPFFYFTVGSSKGRSDSDFDGQYRLKRATYVCIKPPYTYKKTHIYLCYKIYVVLCVLQSTEQRPF